MEGIILKVTRGVLGGTDVIWLRAFTGQHYSEPSASIKGRGSLLVDELLLLNKKSSPRMY